MVSFELSKEIERCFFVSESPGGIEPGFLEKLDQGSRIKDQGLPDQGSPDQGSRIKDQGSRTKDRGPRTEDRGPRTEDRGPRIKDQFKMNQIN